MGTGGIVSEAGGPRGSALASRNPFPCPRFT
jgi:hypothetical protein